jgi:uncharacterized protein
MDLRIVYVHGNQSTHWSFAWATWLKREVELLGFDSFFETMPDSIIARQNYWLPFLEEHVKVGESDIIVGWSTGAVAAMRYAETNKIKGAVLVAPSYTDLNDDLEKASGYFDRPWSWPVIRSNQERIELISANDDPYIPQPEFEAIANSLDAHWSRLPNGGHFIKRSEFPEVLAAIKRIAEVH